MKLPAMMVVTKAIRSSRNTIKPPKNKQEPSYRGIYVVPCAQSESCVVGLGVSKLL